MSTNTKQEYYWQSDLVKLVINITNSI